jgi:hypothetical protein
MAKHRIHSIEFKRQVAQEFLAGKTLHGLAPAQRGLPFDFANQTGIVASRLPCR